MSIFPWHLVVICCGMVLVSCLRVRNIHALDPIGCRRQVHTKGRKYRANLAQHLKEHGQYPETIAANAVGIGCN